MPEVDLTLVDFLKNCGLTGDEAAVQAESLVRNRNGLLFETSTGSHCDETDSNDSYDSMDGLDLGAMIARQNSAQLNRKDELQQDCKKDDATLKVRHRQFIEKKLKDANNEWRGPAEWDADMHDNFQERDRISGGKAYEIALELGMNSS